MPGIDEKMGEVTASKTSFNPREPVFVIRAQDELAAPAIRAYAKLCESAGCHEDHVAGAYRAAELVEEWQEEAATTVHLPD